MSELVTSIQKANNLSRAFLATLEDQIREVYCGDDRPWVIGYSGGKDSTTALQLVWTALLGLPKERRSKPVYVISSDTLVETPMIVSYVDRTLDRIDTAAKAQGLPITSHKVTPTTNDSFWVNVIGRGYPVPSNQFRWCTERLKITPANAFILDRVAEYGEVVVILGVRSSESSTRAQVMSLHRISGSHLSRHSTLPKAFVYTPIEEFSIDDVWTYLLQVPSPWGGNNRDLVTLYRNAQAGECPLVVDTTTPSCGNSRFGCWVCTVVNRDASMEAMVENGEEWLEPLLEFRNRLSALQDSALWPSIRKYKRRDGRVKSKDGAPQPWGPYTIETRKDLLRGLLEVQRTIALSKPEAAGDLITKSELEAIRTLWRLEEHDWADTVPQIYREQLGIALDWVRYETPVFSSEEQQSLNAICDRHDLPMEMVAKLIELERSLQGMSRRASIQRRLASVFEEDWRTVTEIQASALQEHA
ncbi:MAG: DNA phosphorothioation system sulfurtransferase DndC [Acidobacteria bacterium]|nr:DNA phosphorothioation system sulfurtransferase DndC [Acidobacteriota bacterium]